MSSHDSQPLSLWQSINQFEAFPLLRVAYVSRPAVDFDDNVLDDIELKSVVSNNELDVTGMLLVQNDRILQILEGEANTVEALVERISKDSRHTDFTVVSREPTDQRFLLTWSMVVRGPGSAPQDLIDTFHRRYEELRAAPLESTLSASDIDLFKEINLFSNLPSV